MCQHRKKARPMSIERTEFFDIMASFASGVTVVTSAYEGRLIGITVSSFTSLSAEPKLILVCIDKGVSSHDALAASGMFAVNLLSESQAILSSSFASRSEDKFVDVEYMLNEDGLPLLTNTLGHVVCRIVNLLPGGDHTIFIGEVMDGERHDGRPLLYFRRQYHQLG